MRDQSPAKTAREIADSLDGAARANLSLRGVQEFMEYKERLLAEDTSAADIEDILRGFILDASESEGADSKQDYDE